MGLFKGEVPVFARLWCNRVRVKVSFTTGAVRSAILATAGLLVNLMTSLIMSNIVGLVITSKQARREGREEGEVSPGPVTFGRPRRHSKIKIFQ